MNRKRYAVVGGGINGLAVARQLLLDDPGVAVTVFEKEGAVAQHQSSHNSGVVHAGLYYEPGGLKARLCRRGVELVRRYCLENGIPYDECGKVVVALDEQELPRLDAIHKKAVANGVDEIWAGLRIPPTTPPIFLAHATDDSVATAENSAIMYLALKRSGIPVELHIYGSGDHDFGVRQNGKLPSTWTQLCVFWLRSLNLLTAL
jgi:glycine/D-amino acid oxidase-like deaminating enzyme